MKSIAIRTLGCKLNQYESMGMQEALENAGYSIVSFKEKVDLYIINTCTVTGKTDRRSRHAIRQLHKYNPDSKVIVTGCGAQRDITEFSKISGVRAIIGNSEKNRIVDFVKRVLSGEDLIIQVTDLENVPFEKLNISRFRNYTRAFLKIQEGCNRSCSYCVIPHVRGPSRSQDPRQILDEIKLLLKGNFREIVLTGIDLGTYGLDLSPAVNLAWLINQIVQLEDLARVRLSSIEPMEFTDELISTITSSDKVCRHFHIPLQSGCDSILTRMNRNYDTKKFRGIIETLKDKRPDSCIGCDVITAFPGETKEEFESTYRFLESLPVDYLHVFTYSIREGTPAAKFQNHIAPDVAKERCHQLRSLSFEKTKQFRNRMFEKTLPAIVLGTRHKSTNLQRVLTDNYIEILLDADPIAKGSIVDVKITKSQDLTCFGIRA